MKFFTAILVAIIALAGVEDSTAYAKSNKGHCPPGSAKKNPPCVPPGQAKNFYQSGEDYYYGNDYLTDRDRRRYKLPRLAVVGVVVDPINTSAKADLRSECG